MKLSELAASMLACGVRRVVFQDAASTELGLIREVELSDAAPAPVTQPEWTDALEPEPEAKPSFICVATGCGQQNGWFGNPNYCRAHGLRAAGVKS